ncbi:hypothetical protein [Desulfonema magnum]|nr:hypothetical protein [Desulfonema magnum]
MYQYVTDRQREYDNHDEVIMGQSISCDLCGRNGEEQYCKTDSSVCLCSNCLKHTEASNEKIKECVERWLLGNVI